MKPSITWTVSDEPIRPLPRKQMRKLQEAAIQELLVEMDSDIIRAMQCLTNWTPAPDDILGILMVTLRDVLANKVVGATVTCDQYTVRVDRISIRGLEDRIQAMCDFGMGNPPIHRELSPVYKQFDYNHPDLIPSIVTWVKKQLREERKLIRKAKAQLKSAQ